MSMAMKYGMMKKAEQGCDAHGMKDCGECMAGGGFVEDEMASGYMAPPEPKADMGEEGIVDRIIKRFSKGGMAANDTPPIADGEEADYDELAKDDDEDSSYVDDGPGDKQEDEDRKDIVARAMKARATKGRMPRPA